MTIKLALLGKDISHSYYQTTYEKILDKKIAYTLYDIDVSSAIPTLSDFFSKCLDGLSITSPYKKHFVNDVEINNKDIRSLGVVNSIKTGPNSSFYATNTDYLAAEELLKKYLIIDQDIVILGSGSMAMMFSFILKKMSLSYDQYSRDKNVDIQNIDFSIREKPLLLINCCSRKFVFKGRFANRTIFWDMNYNFPPHQRLSDQVVYVDGLEFLELQARYALTFFDITI
jgi:shikimate dehydrogenase